MKDVPLKLVATEAQLNKYAAGGDVDPKHFERWDYIMDEMIWAFEQKCRDDWESDYYEYEDDDTERYGLKLVREDREGSKAHHQRMINGFKLFGKYYESLWD